MGRVKLQHRAGNPFSFTETENIPLLNPNFNFAVDLAGLILLFQSKLRYRTSGDPSGVTATDCLGGFSQPVHLGVVLRPHVGQQQSCDGVTSYLSGFCVWILIS